VPVASVILCVRNAESTLDRQLAALQAQDVGDPWELIVVDNGSIDASRAIAASWCGRIPRMRIVDEPEVGTNRARNRGLREARTSAIAFCDADDEVSAPWLREIVLALEHFDVVGGALDPERLNGPDAPRTACIQQTELPNAFGWRWAVGANLAFRADVGVAIDGFDPAFIAGSDDTDFCLRAQYRGFSIGFAPDAVVSYRIRSSPLAIMRQRLAYGRGHERLVEKHARLGHVQSTRVQRWKAIGVQASRVIVHVPDIARRRTRLQYLAAVGYLVGRAAELAAESRNGRGA
jgi:glycosyltransferase involved in cell wall biosynthesis